jgi:hypothetical protein
MVASTARLPQRSRSITFRTASLLQPTGRHKTQPHAVPQMLVASIAGRPQHTAGKCFRDELFASTFLCLQNPANKVGIELCLLQSLSGGQTQQGKVSGKNCLLQPLGGRKSQQ